MSGENHKELAERAYWADKLGLKKKVSDREAELAIQAKRKNKLTLDGGLVNLPRPEILVKGWETSPVSLPNMTRDNVDVYIRAGKLTIFMIIMIT